MESKAAGMIVSGAIATIAFISLLIKLGYDPILENQKHMVKDIETLRSEFRTRHEAEMLEAAERKRVDGIAEHVTAHMDKIEAEIRAFRDKTEERFFGMDSSSPIVRRK